MMELSDLPPEVLQIVFSCLPLQTLLTTCTRVCSQWRDIISENKFLQWRKLYYRYKADSELTFQDVTDEDQPRPLEHYGQLQKWRQVTDRDYKLLNY